MSREWCEYNNHRPLTFHCPLPLLMHKPVQHAVDEVRRLLGAVPLGKMLDLDHVVTLLPRRWPTRPPQGGDRASSPGMTRPASPSSGAIGRAEQRRMDNRWQVDPNRLHRDSETPVRRCAFPERKGPGTDEHIRKDSS